MAAVCVAGFACAFAPNAPPLLAAPLPLLSAVLLAIIFCIAGAFGTFETTGDLAEHHSLTLPTGLAMLLLLDWRHFLFAVVLGHVLTFASETIRRVNPTIWYVRIFNVCDLIVAGTVTGFVLRELHALFPTAATDHWTSPALFVTLGVAVVVWKLLDDADTKLVIALAAGQRLSFRLPAPRPFFAQLTLCLVAIPFAVAWQHNIWLSLFTLAPLGVAFRLLGVAELEHRANVDRRTGLANAAFFDEKLEDALDDAQKRGRTVALIAIDIDRFKSINDRHGHLVGDAVIKGLADVLSRVARHSDFAARTGGEEFAFVLHEGNRTGAIAFAERLRSELSALTFEGNQRLGRAATLAVTASFGVAIFPDDAATPRELCLAADSALYAAKRDGRDRVRSAAPLIA